MENPELAKAVIADGELKQLFVDYVGQKLQPENDEVTVEMVIATLAEEFPEVVMVIAEENWIMGYKQAIDDSEQPK